MKNRLIYILMTYSILVLISIYIYSNINIVNISSNYQLISLLKVRHNDENIILEEEIDFTNDDIQIVKYSVGNVKYNITVNKSAHYKELTAVESLSVEIGQDIDPLDFIENRENFPNLLVEFNENYNFNQIGCFEIQLSYYDYNGTKYLLNTLLNIHETDKEAPEMICALDLIIEINTEINFLDGLICIDNIDDNPSIEVINSFVDLTKVGIYQVIYKLSDVSSNETYFIRDVQVVEKLEIGKIDSTDEKILYLTFDDGPSEYTSDVLEILNKYNVQATFFIIGSNEDYIELIKDIHNEGHTVGLHSYSHEYNEIYSSVDDYFIDLTKISNICKELIGYMPRYVRFPGGSSNKVSIEYSQGIMTSLVCEIKQRGLQYYDWNVTSGDGEKNTSTASIIEQSIDSKLNNIILLMHDANNKKTTVEALPTIIEYYLNQGYSFKGIDDNSYVYHHTVNN